MSTTVSPVSRLFRLLSVCGLMTLLISGCSGPRPTLEGSLPSAFPNHTPTQIRYALASTHDSLHAFSARSSLVYRAPENGGSFSTEMRDRRGDSLYVSISPGLGIEAARALVTADSFFFYDRLKNRVVYGAIADAGDLLPDPFTSEDLFANLLGLPVPNDGIDWQVDADEQYYYLSDPAGSREFVVDPAHWRVVRYEERDGEGRVVDRRVFSEFDAFDGVVLPRRLIFERPLDNRRASLYHRSLSINPGPLRFSLDVRDSAERILLATPSP